MKTPLFVFLAVVLLSSCTMQADPPAELVAQLVKARLGPGAEVASVRRAGVADLFEVVAEGEVFYVDQGAQHLIAGHIFGGRSLRNLTMKRLDEIHAVDFSSLPLRFAVRQVHGTGQRKLVIFEDPNCGYCRRFRENELGKIKNVTVYTFLYPVLGADSEAKARAIWCAPDRYSALRDWTMSQIAPPPAPQSCMDPSAQLKTLGKKLHVNGTPAFYFSDGSRVMGAAPSAVIEHRLAASADAQ